MYRYQETATIKLYNQGWVSSRYVDSKIQRDRDSKAIHLFSMNYTKKLSYMPWNLTKQK